MNTTHLAHLAHVGLKLVEMGWDAWKHSRPARPAPSDGTYYSAEGRSGLRWYAVPPAIEAAFIREAGPVTRASRFFDALSKNGCDRDTWRQVQGECQEMARAFPGMTIFVAKA